MNKRNKHFAMLRAEEKRRNPPTKAQKRNLISTYLKNMGGYKHNQLKSKRYEEIQKLFDNEMRRVNTFIPMDSEVVKSKKETEESSKGTKDELEFEKSKKAESSKEKAKGSKKKILGKKRAVKEQQQESSKRQRMEDDKETDEHEEVEVDDEAELKKHLVIVKDDDIAIDAIPLATNHQMLQDIDREDLETLWKLVKTKHGDIRPENEHERVLKRACEKNQLMIEVLFGKKLKLVLLEAELIEEERIARKKEEEANIALIKSWDNIQTMMEADFELAQKLQTEEQGKITIEERSRLFVELMNKRKKHFAMLRAEEKRRKPPTKAQKGNLMSTYLKNMGGYKHNQLNSKSYEGIQKLFDNEIRRVNTFIPMDSKVVKSKKETEESSKGTKDELEFDKSKKAESSEEKAKGGRKKILGKKRAGKEQQQESSKRQRMEDDKETDEHEEVEVDDEAELKKHLVIVKDDDIAIDAIPLGTKPPVIDIDREDLETLWKLVKTKHGDTRPEDEHERVFWGDLKVMFEPDIKSDVWRNLQGYKVTIWKLYDSCGVHFVSTAGEKVYAAELQLLEDLLLSRG
ncbi:hypothetical protein Tco_0874437 [Tanacetum coccineum]|uniref:Uncharacterized protein n=1 Tax=Tanacetum coccineum TaxID=301880 RepID=A0ABQ5BLY9_9ASTR